MSPIDKQKSIFFKFLSIFSVVRIYNILIIVLAQYLTSIFILSDKKLFDVIFDFIRAFLTLNVLVFPPFISSIFFSLISLKILLFLITKVIFLNPIFFNCSILCSRMVLSFNFDKSLFSFVLNLVLLPAASSTI